VLAGDALHALAFALLAQTADGSGIPPARAVGAIAEITHGIGTQGMVGGQVLDLLASRGPVAAADVQRIHQLKTGSLIRACVRVGGMLGGATQDDLESLSRYGEHIGLAFQIIDDILDVVGEEAKLGKGIGSDAAQAKVTFPAVFGLDASRSLAEHATAQAIQVLEPLGARGKWLRDLAIFLLSRER
jgi:geranylgeranyl diphosphate synthase type II